MGDYGRSAAFPDLASWLASRYALVYEGDAFRVYVARNEPQLVQ